MEYSINRRVGKYFFISDGLLQNVSVTWNTNNPDLTPCFEKTVLAWIPCLFLWIFSPLEVFYMLSSKQRNIPWSWLNISKFVSFFNYFLNRFSPHIKYQNFMNLEILKLCSFDCIISIQIGLFNVLRLYFQNSEAND